jgi:K+-dependent Na+/Ca+ exchanger-like protein
VHGGLALYLLGIAYMFVGIAVICEEDFKDSLLVLSQALKLPPDVAGATFMAAGTSSPELFASLVALGATSNDIGSGTVVGSVIFNLLVIIGACVVFAKKTFHLKWRVMVRDALWNGVAFIYLLASFWDEQITWIEALVGVSLYALYVVSMAYNQRIMDALDKWLPALAERVSCGYYVRPQHHSVRRVELDQRRLLSETTAGADVGGVDRHDGVEDLEIDLDDGGDDDDDDDVSKPLDDDDANVVVGLNNGAVGVADNGDEAPKLSVFAMQVHSPDSVLPGKEVPLDDIDSVSGDEDDEEPEYEEVHDHPHPLSVPPQTTLSWIAAILFLPWKLIYWYTVPRPTHPRFKYMFVISFSTCLIWLALLTWMMIEWTTKVGCIIGISDAIMGATLLAIGTSTPDCLTSIAVARSGQGTMAVSNALGSNIFDILLALGLPWLLSTVIEGEVVQVASDTILSDAAMCAITLAIVMLSLRFSQWKLTPRLGFVYFGVYAVFLIYLIWAGIKAASQSD